MKPILTFLILTLTSGNVSAQFTKLFDFAAATSGERPKGSLVSDGTFLYGTTFAGGTYNEGTLFQIMPNGTGYVKLYDFNSSNGSNPRGSIISDGTFLYGMIDFGGNHGVGTIIKYQFSAISGISDNKNTLVFSAFPNPVNDILTIQNPFGVTFQKVIITDLTGKKVREQTINQTQIDVSQLPTGMYLLQIASDGKNRLANSLSNNCIQEINWNNG